MNTDHLGELISSLYTQLLCEYHDAQRAALETARLINQLMDTQQET